MGRGGLLFIYASSVPLDQVEPWMMLNDNPDDNHHYASPASPAVHNNHDYALEDA